MKSTYKAVEVTFSLNKPRRNWLGKEIAIKSGNSGSPVFNLNGEVMGIVSNIMSRCLFTGISSAADGEVSNSHPTLASRFVTALGHLAISRHLLSTTTALGIEEATS